MSKRLYGCIVVLAALAWSRPAHAALSVTPSPTVGSVVIGTSGSVTDTIDSNVASPGEVLDKIVVTGGAPCAVFSVAPTAATLPQPVASDNPLPITVTFTPTTRGPLTCTVNLLGVGDILLGTFQVSGTGLGPKITVPATVAFGSVRVANAATLTASGVVVIQNTGDAGQTLNITALQITGDFTIPSPPTLPAAIAPGGTLSIGVVFDPSASGARSGSLVITSNDPVMPMATVALSGTGTNAVIGVTDVAFGTVTNGTIASLDITVANTATAPVGPLRVASATIAGGSWFTFGDGGCANQTACTLGIDVTTSTLVGVRCAPPADATGTQSATVTFTSDSDPGGASVSAITCTAGRANIAVDKPTLAFGDVLINTSSAAQTVTVTNNGTLPLTYSASKVGAQQARYTLGGSCFAGCTVPANGGTQSFAVTFSPNVEGSADIVINLDTNDPDAGDDPFVIVVTGRGVAPRISGPAVVAVGDVEVGKTSVMQPLIVTNTGTSPLTISSATLAAGATDYTIMGTAGSQTIPAGSMGMWSVFCSPQAQGARPGTFRIISDATNAPTLDVPLTCNGTRGFLVVVPATHAFGGVAQGTTASTTVTLRNTGNLAVSGITAAVLPANVGYTLVAATVPSTLAAGASASVTVQFAPTATADGGAATATFTGSWGTSPTTTTATLSLTGDGLTIGYDVSATAIDFGNLRFDTQPTRTFCITNTDQAIVTIQSLVITPGANTASNEFVVVDVKKQTTCGTGGVSVVLPQPLAQGEILEVTVRAQPANRLGAMAATLVVGSNLPSNPNRSVTLAGNSTSAMLTLVPGATLDFGAVDVQGPPAVRQVTLRNTGNAPLDLASFARTASPSFTLALPANTTLAPNAEITIVVTYAPTIARAAGSEEAFTISHSIAGALGAPAIGTVVVRGRGIDRDLVLGPTPVFPDTFRNPGTLGPVRIVAVTNPGEAPLQITATMVSNDTDVWKLLDTDPIVVPPGATVELRVRFEPKLAGPAPSARLQIVNDDDDDGPPVMTKITEVVLSGNGVARNVQLNPNRFDVGYVDVGSSISLPEALVVKSFDSASSFTIQTIEIEGGDGAFTIEETVDGIALGPDGERRFTVTFSPERPGEFTARARLFLDLDPEHQAEVEIHGIAVFVDARGGGGCNTGEGVGGGALILIALVALRRRRAAIVALAAVLAMPAAARADENILLTVFAPTPATTSDSFQLQSPAIGAHGDWAVGAVFSYATDPLLHLASDGGQHGVITSSSVVVLGGAISVLGRFELGALMPFYSQNGEARGDRFLEYTTDPANGTATGDLTVHGKTQLWRRNLSGNGAVRFGASIQLTLPTATDGKLTGVDDPTSRVVGLASLVPGAFANRVTLSANAGVVIRAATEYRNLEQKSGFVWGLGTAVRVADPLWITAEVFGDLVPSGRESVDGSMTTLSPIEWLGGLRWRPDHRFTVSIAAGRGLTSAAGAPALRGVFALTFAPRGEKLRPIHAPPPPKPDIDSDGDGLFDRVDRCPDAVEDVDLFDDTDGCPDLDNDGDGIADTSDRCGLDVEDKDGFEDDDGCPEKDNDKDGMLDAADKCPSEAEDKDGFQDADGCADHDNDRDGIADAQDGCPLEPEVVNGVTDSDGCPDRGESLVLLGPDRLETLGGVQFQNAKLAKASFNLLGQIAATLRAHPEIVRVRVSCHVQPTSNESKDQALSEKRAEAVRDWLVQWGIAPDRIDIRGFGGSKPLVPADQRGAAQLNERVELIIMDRK